MTLGPDFCISAVPDCCARASGESPGAMQLSWFGWLTAARSWYL